MDNKVILGKTLALVYRSRRLGITEHDDFVRSILSTIKTSNVQLTMPADIMTEELKEFISVLLESKEPYEKEVIIQRIKFITAKDPKLSELLIETIEPDYDDSVSKRVITSTVKLLNNYYKEHVAVQTINKLAYDIKFNRSKITNFSEHLQKVIAELEPLAAGIVTTKDPAIVNEIDFESPENLESVLEEVKGVNNHKHVYQFGWQAFNRMTQGGIRRGEFMTIGALQHKYKTGFSLSLFMQIARHNKPIFLKKEEEEKKPLLLRISFEDSLTNNVQFMYQYLKAHDGEIITGKDFDNTSTKEMSAYILSKLTSTGFYIKMMRVDPNQWSYMHIVNKIVELEAQGYNVHLLMLDYLTLVPTTGCTTGPLGFDKKDLLRRVKNFCSGRNISTITPIQLSSEAKILLRNGIPENQFVNEVSEKGYYDGTKSIDQDIDLEVFIHLFSHKRKKYLAVRRGKHRIPTVIDDDDKYFMLKFPGLNIPILEDIDKEDSSFRILPKDTDSNSTDGLLAEVLGS